MFVYSVRASALRFVSVIVVSVIALAALIVFVPTYVPTAVLVGEDKYFSLDTYAIFGQVVD